MAKSSEALLRRKLRSVLDEEIAALPERLRGPIILCYLEGRPTVQAARDLRCTKTTLARRITRARTLLRISLLKRGLRVSNATLHQALRGMAAKTPVPALLIIKTVKAALLVAAGKSPAGIVSARVLALAEEALASFR